MRIAQGKRQPLSRYSGADLAREVTRRGIVAQISGRTICRWLDEDAIKPWQHRSWIFPRDPAFQAKAERVLDLQKRADEYRLRRADLRERELAFRKRKAAMPAAPPRAEVFDAPEPTPPPPTAACQRAGLEYAGNCLSAACADAP